jgi:SAM-dependent methyltransferase
MECTAYEDRRMRLIAREVHGPRVLDIGYAKRPNPYLQELRPIGLDLLDPSPAAVEGIYAERVIGDAHQATALFPGTTFDTVTCGEFIEHLEDPYGFLRSVRPLLGPDSRLVMSTPNPLAPPIIFFEMSRSAKRYYVEGHYYYFLPRWMRRMLNVTGYELERIVPVGFGHPLFVVPSPVMLSYQLIYVARPGAVSGVPK